MPFYAHPTADISPGDVFTEIPFSVAVAPTRVARTHSYSPPAGRGPAEFKRIYTLPQDLAALTNSRLSSQQGEDILANVRFGKALFLSWGSEVESTLRAIEHSGRIGKRAWLSAPIFKLADIPAGNTEEDPETHEQTPFRELIRRGNARDYFYLPPFPEQSPEEHYADLRKITTVGVQYFREGQGARIATLTEASLNEMFSHLLWSLTRAEFFFRPIQCECGRTVPVDIRFHGQNIDAEDWV
jgi:hypothetical protein